MSLGLALRMLQQCFVKWDFISEMNVTKEFCPEAFIAPKTIQAGDAMGVPPPRCPICTLPMPCAHCDEQELASQGLERREELPRYENALACPCFVKYGYCVVASLPRAIEIRVDGVPGGVRHRRDCIVTRRLDHPRDRS